MRKSGLSGRLDMEEEPSLEEIGCSTEVATGIPSSIQLGDIDLRNYLLDDLPIDFTSVRRWKNICLQGCEKLVDQTTIMGTKYLVFSKVTKDDLVKIDRSHRGLPIRIFYDSSMELLIVKLRAGKAHGWVGNLFADLLREKVRSRFGDARALNNMGSFRCTSPTGREKEPDVALVPRNRNRVEDWPSIVIEVGVLESLPALRSDAHFWILHSAGFTRVVLLIVVDSQSKMIKIERWGDNPSLYPSYGDRLRMVQSVTIDTNGVVGAPLDLPLSLIFDIGYILQGVLATDDISFDVNELVAFFEEFWSMLN